MSRQYRPWPLPQDARYPLAVVYEGKYERLIWLAQNVRDLLQAYREIIKIFQDNMFLTDLELEELDAAVFQESDPRYLSAVYGKMIANRSGGEYEKVYLTTFENSYS